MTRYAKDGAGGAHASGIAGDLALCRERQDQAAALLQPVQPGRRRPRRAGIDVDHVRRIEGTERAVALDDLDIGPACEIRLGARREIGIELDAGDAAPRPDHVRHERGVVADAGADMDDVLSGTRHGLAQQPGVQRGLAVVEAALGHDAEQGVIVEMHRIGRGRGHVAFSEFEAQPGTGAEKRLARYGSEGVFDSGIGDPHNAQYLLGIGRPNRGERRLIVHPTLPRPLSRRRELL